MPIVKYGKNKPKTKPSSSETKLQRDDRPNPNSQPFRKIKSMVNKKKG